MKVKPIVKNNLSREEEWPSGRSGHCMCSDENYLYVFGGYNPKKSHAVYSELWRFNTTSDRWCKLPDADGLSPKLCLSSSMVKCKGSLIVFGGTTYPFGQQIGSSLSFYSLKSFKWFQNVQRAMNDQRLMNDSSMNEIRVKRCGCVAHNDVPPIPKYGQTMVVSPSNDRLYIFAGTDGFMFSNELHSFCLREMCWVRYRFCPNHLASQPSPRYRHETVVNKEGFFVFGGGGDIDHAFDFKQVEYFSFADEKWNKKQCGSTVFGIDDVGGDRGGGEGGNSDGGSALYPPARKSHTCSIYNGKVYMIGGFDNQLLFQDIWILDVQTMTWCAKKSFPHSVYFHTSAITSFGCMYVFGGANGNGDRVSDLHYVCLTVPPLRRLAWIRCAQLLQRNGKFSKEALAQLNVPKCFWRWVDEFSLLPGA